MLCRSRISLFVRPVKSLQSLRVRVERFSQNVDQDGWTAVVSGRRIPPSPDQQHELIRQPPEKVAGSRLLKVAILGEPNAGKSTLINQLSGWPTCSVSSKVHTTRKMSRTVLMEGATQIVFLDTPGLTLPAESKKHNLESNFLIDPEKAIMQADMLLVLHDVSNKWTRGFLSPKILRLLHFYPDKESILVVNKVDRIKEKRLLLKLSSQLTEGVIGGQAAVTTPVASITTKTAKPQVTLDDLQKSRHVTPIGNEVPDCSNDTNSQPDTGLTESQIAKAIQGKIGWPNFSRLFLISALDGDGVQDVQEHLIASARPGKWMYNSSVVTDQDPHALATATVREKLLDLLSDELPYKVDVSVRMWDVDSSGTLNVVMVIDCRKHFTAKCVVGVGGRTIVRLCHETEQQLRNIFRREVRLRLVVEPSQKESQCN